MQISFVSQPSGRDAVLAHAAIVREGGALSAQARRLDELTGGALSRAVRQGRFSGAAGQTLDIIAPQGVEAARILLVGVAGTSPLTPDMSEVAAAQAYKALKTSGVDELLLDFGTEPVSAARAALGARLAAYRFDRYRTREKADEWPSLSGVQILVGAPERAQAAYADLSALADAILFCRDLVSEPANILYPDAFADRLRAQAVPGLEVEILGVAEMQALPPGRGPGQRTRKPPGRDDVEGRGRPPAEQLAR